MLSGILKETDRDGGDERDLKSFVFIPFIPSIPVNYFP
jgi:hypothetical protein